MKSISAVLILFIISTSLYAQNTPNDIVNDAELITSTIGIVNPKTIKFTEPKANGKIKKVYYKSGQLKSENHFISSTIKKFHGKQSYWFENGEISSEIYFKNGKKEGSAKYYWDNGQIKRHDVYENGILKNGKCWNETGKKIKYTKYNTQPEFPGGNKALATYFSKNLQYPTKSKNASCRGKVIVNIQIEKDGSVSNVSVIKGVNLVLNKEAKRVVSNMPNWKPALLNGKPINDSLTLPIVFFRN